MTEKISHWAWVGMKYRPSIAKDPERYAESIAKELGFTMKTLSTRNRSRHLVEARQIIMYLLRERYPNYSLKNIGILFGGKDHTTVIHSIAAVQCHIDCEPEYKETIDRLMWV